MTTMLRSKGLFIAGAWEPAGDVEDVVNPATEAVIGRAPVGSQAAVLAAIDAAREAFDKGPWPTMKPAQRQEYLQRFLDAIRAREEDICRLITAEAGATLVLARTLQFGIPLRIAQHIVDICTRDPITPVAPQLNDMGQTTLLGCGVYVREPVGVAAIITPYNVPFFLNLAKSVPALATGCTVVLKPSAFTPFEALILGEIAEEVGLPKGVLNIVTGGPDVGRIMTTDERVDLVSFTGSDKVGEAILAQAAPSLKRVLLELGGKSALIVRPDADLDAAVRDGLFGFTAHCGQGCQLLTRHLVHNSIREAYVEKVSAIATRLVIGDPAAPETQVGPLIRNSQRLRTEHYVEKAKAEGARLVIGGRRPADRPRGYFYEPTLFSDVRNDMTIAQEEVFGPVGVVIGFDTDEEAIAIANDSRFGLNGAVHSADTGRAYEMALRLRTGGVAINGGAGGILSAAPFGGIKRSGFGREFGIEGLNEYTYTKTIAFRAV
ncbi:aldehyde dehydrogenase family protein [Bradyrhizobium sp. Pear77]|uniref:aldehyde dehydrogenase family protein n=1 Tax=Bradyrhizobium altum TaxID=1571202 RepID=UPI001E370F1F|nr:aldehyde dehydrogenase family protein [Bradyrhizobium altum]MCC8952757.1 aldehyde dehydrogenase family protein [Bradyrhizobium altum]